MDFQRCVMAASLVSVMMCGCEEPISERARRESVRPADKDLSHVKSWSFTLNGIPFEDRPLLLTVGEEIHLIGEVEIVEGAVPPYSVPELLIALRPHGEAQGEEWSSLGERNFHLEIRTPIIEGTVDRTRKIRPDYIPPGDYDARLYFRVWDFTHGRSYADLIATSRITVLPGKVASSQ